MDAIHQRLSKRPQLFIAAVVLATCTSMLTGLATAQSNFQTADVFAIPPSNPLDLTGAAWFKRTESRIQGRIMTKVDKAGFAHTVWIVVFNNPQNCGSTPCMDMDLFNPEVRGEVYYGSSAISALSPPGGVINVDLAIRDDGLPEGIFDFNQLELDGIIFPDEDLSGVPIDGLDADNGMCAEIHLVVDFHPGPVKTDQVSWVPDLTRTDFPITEAQLSPPVLGASGTRAAIFPGLCGQD
jgi:hypothetical protein